MNGHAYGTNTLNVTRHVPTTVQSELWPVNGNVGNGSNARLQEWVERHIRATSACKAKVGLISVVLAGRVAVKFVLRRAPPIAIESKPRTPCVLFRSSGALTRQHRRPVCATPPRSHAPGARGTNHDALSRGV